LHFRPNLFGISSYIRLQQLNKWRNDALSNNLSLASAPTSKVHRVLGPPPSESKSKWRHFLFAKDSHGRIVLDVLGLVIVVYYMLAVPFHFAYVYGPSTQWITSDVIVAWFMDALCYLECIWRFRILQVMQEAAAKSANSRFSSSETPYDDPLYSTRLAIFYDLCGILPIDLFVLLPRVPFSAIYAFRLVRMLRVMNVFGRLGQVISARPC
jgi:hypothetical protein